MTHVIGASGTSVPINKRLARQFGYDPVRFTHHPVAQAAYVLRRCAGCGQVRRFAPLPGATRQQMCMPCMGETSWTLVEPRV